jgi:hypothetical protein
VGGPPSGDQWGVLADPHGLAVAGSACLLWELEDGLQRAPSLVRRRHWAAILNELRRGCDHGEGEWAVAVDSARVRARQHAAGGRRLPPADLDTGGLVE